MIKFIYEPTKSGFTSLEDPAPVKGITMELNDDVSWEEATQEFHNFLRGAGYVIPYDYEYEDSGSLDDQQREWAQLSDEKKEAIIREWNKVVFKKDDVGYIDCSDPPDMDKSGSLGDRQPEWANRISDSCPECKMPYGNHKMDCSRGRGTHHER